MASRTLLVYAGLFLLGLVLLAVGALTQPYRVGATPGSEVGESLVAIGLTFVILGIGYFLAWANPTQSSRLGDGPAPRAASGSSGGTGSETRGGALADGGGR